MTQLYVLTHGGAAQVEVAVFHAQLIATVGVVLDGEGRRETGAEHIELAHDDLDVASGHLAVLALALRHCTRHLDAVFATELVGLVAEVLVDGSVKHELCEAVAVAQVGECHAAHLTCALDPSGECYFLAGVGETQLSTSFRSIHNR